MLMWNKTVLKHRNLLATIRSSHSPVWLGWERMPLSYLYLVPSYVRSDYEYILHL